MGRRSTHTPAQLRELILTAATDLIVESGLNGLSAREIARRIGYSPGTLYNVFRDLADLILTIEMRMLDALAVRIASLPTETDPAKHLSAIGSAYLSFSMEQPRLWNLLVEHTPDLYAEVPPQFQERVDVIIGEIERPVAGLIGSSTNDRLRRESVAIWSGIHGIATLANSPKLIILSRDDATGLLDQFIETYRAGLTKVAERETGPQTPGQGRASNAVRRTSSSH